MARPLTIKQEKFIQATIKGLNGFEAAKEASYKGSDNTLRAIASENLTKLNIIQAIDKIKAVIAKKVEHSYEIAVDMLTQRLAWLDIKAKEGNVQAIQAQTAIIRELDCITGLQKQNIITEKAEREQLSESERAEAAKIARVLNLEAVRKDIKVG